jgi:O-antigen/teichoic acid export membrane protein
LIRLANLALRGLTLVSKFLLLFFLAKFLEPDEVGLYGLIAATIGYALYALGLEFYNFSTREIIGKDPRLWLGLIRDQMVLYALVYLILLPLALIVFYKEWLPWAYAVWFFLLLFLEHMAQEFNRILVAISEQLLASIVLFMRSGIWGLVVIAAMWSEPGTRTLAFCLGAWALGALLACAVAISRLAALDKGALKAPVNWRWILRGIKIAVPLLAASLAIRGIFTFDRYWVEGVAGLDVLGPYVLFIGMAMAILSFLDAGVIVFFYPKLVASAKLSDSSVFKSDMRKLFFNVAGTTLIFVLACGGLAPVVLHWLNNPIYDENLYLLYWLLLAITIYAFSMIPHLGLYAHNHDRPIFLSQLAAFFLFVAVAYLGQDHFGVLIIPVSMCVAFGMILVWKLIAFRLANFDTNRVLS